MNTSATPPRPADSRPDLRRAVPWIRSLHRFGSIIAVLLMLWLSITGMSMQVIDLHAILTHEPVTTPTGLSIAEGMYGPADYAVVQSADFAAPALPAEFDIRQAVHTVLQAAHTQQSRDTTASPAAPPNSLTTDGSAGLGGPGGGSRATAEGPGGGQLGPMAWMELRMLNGAPAGQVMLGTKLIAFNAETGASIAAIPPAPIPQGGRLPPSLRQNLKTLHRFWNRNATPGVYFELVIGLFLLFLVVSGLVMYFQMLGLRVRRGSWQPLWIGGGWWRALHRGISILAAAFLLCISLSGTWIGLESSTYSLRRALMPPSPTPGAAPQGAPGQRGRRRNPIDFIIPLHDQEVEEMTDTTLNSMRRLHPSTQIKAIRLRIYGQMKQGVVIAGAKDIDQYVFNADSGEAASLTEEGYPVSFPFGTQVHENVKHFHSGAMFGVSGRVMNLFGGFSLAFLSISGLVMYFNIWLKRRRAGRGSFVWR